MSETANNTGQICTQKEFEHLESIHKRFRQALREPGLSVDEHERLIEDFDNFSPRIIEIGRRVGLDMREKIKTLVEILIEFHPNPPRGIFGRG
jgi:hypothetical protein